MPSAAELSSWRDERLSNEKSTWICIADFDWAIKGNGVPTDAPPIFVLAASDDSLGLAPQSVKIYQDWIAAGKSAELHLYSKGGHGFGMRTQHLPSDHWIERFADWLDVQGLLKP